MEQLRSPEGSAMKKSSQMLLVFGQLYFGWLTSPLCKLGNELSHFARFCNRMLNSWSCFSWFKNFDVTFKFKNFRPMAFQVKCKLPKFKFLSS